MGNIYRPPKDNNENYKVLFDELALVLEKLQIMRNEVVIAGDFNIDLLQINEKPLFNEYFNMIVSNGFIPKITLPTRITDRSGTLIDNFLCKLSNNFSKTTAGILLNNISDHQPYFICLDFLNNPSQVTKYIEMRTFITNF